MSRELLVELDRKDEYCIMRFADGESFRIGYLKIRSNCQCAKCKPRQENEQRKIEFEQEIMRLRLEKPKESRRPLRNPTRVADRLLERNPLVLPPQRGL